MSVFNTANKADHTKVLAFLDPTGGPTIQRYDTLKYKSFDGLTDKQLGFFWRPEEVDVNKMMGELEVVEVDDDECESCHI